MVEVEVSNIPAPQKEKAEAEQQLEKKEMRLSASMSAPETEGGAEETVTEPGSDASMWAAQPEEKEDDGEGPGVDASRWAPKPEGGKEMEGGKGQERSKWHLRRLGRRENRRHSDVPLSRDVAPAPEWPPCVAHHLLRLEVVVKWRRGRGRCRL